MLLVLTTVRPWGRRVPAWMLLAPAGVAATFMVLRAALRAVGDVITLASGGATGEATRLARWDLLFWSPFFLVWGVLWGLTGRTFARHRGVRRTPC